MTLVQVLANEKSVYMACDFKITFGEKHKNCHEFAHKLVRAGGFRFSAEVGFSGVAILGGRPVGDGLAEAAADLDQRAVIEDFLDQLKRAESPLGKLPPGTDRRLTFAVGAMVGTQSIVALVSNFEKLINGRIARLAVAEATMTVTKMKPKGEIFLATGDTGRMKSEDYSGLILSLRSGADDERIYEQMKKLNEEMSARTTTIGKGCYVASLNATGYGASVPFIADDQQGDFIPPDTALMMKRLGLKFNRELDPSGQPASIRAVKGTSVIIRNTPEFHREQLKLRPESAEVWNNYAVFLLSRQRWVDAIHAFEKAISLDPGQVAALSNLARQVWIHLRDFPRADALFSRAVAAGGESPDPVTMSDFAIFCEEGLADIARAAELHDRAVVSNNPLAIARKALFAAKHQGDPKLAEELITSALMQQPSNTTIICIAGKIDLETSKNPAIAVEKFHKACSLAPNDPFVLAAAADSCRSVGDFASAAYYYRKLIKQADRDPNIDSNYGLVLLLEKKPEGALRHLSRAAHAAPGNLNIQVNKAAALWACGRHDEAIAAMCAIMEAEPPLTTKLEVNALFLLAVPESARETKTRMKQLIKAGIRVDGSAVKGMCAARPQDELNTAIHLAEIIEGNIEIPADWY